MENLDMTLDFDLVFFLIIAVIALTLLGFVISLIQKQYKSWQRRKYCAAWRFDPERVFISSSRLSHIRDYWEAREPLIDRQHRIDAITWDDLDMDDVFRRMDACRSSAGEEVLYARLHETGPDETRQRRFLDAVAYFDGEEAVRRSVWCQLDEIGRKTPHLSSGLLFGRMEGLQINRLFYALLGILPIALLIANALYPGAFIYAIPAVALNLIVGSRNRHKLLVYTDTIGYLMRCLKTARKLHSFPHGDYGRRLSAATRQVGKIRLPAFLATDHGEGLLSFFMEMLKGLFLLDYICFGYLLRFFDQNRAAFREIYEIIGELDMAIAVGAFRETLPRYAEPEFVGGRDASFEGLYHPLLAHPVDNDLAWTKNCIITGSNASGKSTFIKATAISLITAQTVGLVFARSYRGGHFLVMTSMAIRDSVISGDSYFITELKCLGRILDMVGDGLPVACFVDEILRGTNTQERISAAASVLDWLARENCRVMVASHDIELTEILGRVYDNCHFREQVAGDEMYFDYRLYPGPTNTKNAIRLMAGLDFDPVIIREAAHISDTFEKDRAWPVL